MESKFQVVQVDVDSTSVLEDSKKTELRGTSASEAASTVHETEIESASNVYMHKSSALLLIEAHYCMYTYSTQHVHASVLPCQYAGSGQGRCSSHVDGQGKLPVHGNRLPDTER